jgi:hypothetical protein
MALWRREPTPGPLFTGGGEGGGEAGGFVVFGPGAGGGGGF